MSSLPGSEKRCWCSSQRFTRFSEHYLKCSDCGTLVLEAMPTPEKLRVKDDTQDFYGREYWLSHQTQNYNHPDIFQRARNDLPERCLYWLKTLLKYKLPPGKTLELGSAHGGFVAMLQWSGFDATGLEMSPWLVEFAQQTFNVPMVCGPVEDQQQVEPNSFDAIVLMDVLEHLADPVATMQHCATLLKPDGLMLVQTPCYPENKNYADLVEHNDRFLIQLKEKEHLYLFSKRSARLLFQRLGLLEVNFEPALFEYDMFFVASRNPVTTNNQAEITDTLTTSAQGRLILALLDLNAEKERIVSKLQEAEADRAARLEVIQQQGRRLGELEAERNVLQAQLADLRQQFEVVEADRAARLQVIETQGRRLGEVEAERNVLQAQLADLRQQFEVVEADRAARLKVIEQQGQEKTRLQAERDQAVQTLMAIAQTPAYKLLSRLGCLPASAGRPGRTLVARRKSSLNTSLRHQDVTHARGVLGQPLSDYQASIDLFNASQPNKALLDSIRLYNHSIVDQMNSIRTLRGCLLLDIGASPHGYALERALEHGVALYAGIGLDVAESQYVLNDGNVGLLLNMDATSLQFPKGIFDWVVSISTFEHVADVAAVLSEIARVLKPGGLALISFEPIWSCSYGHHLHHFGECAKLVPPWAHLMWTPEQMRSALAEKWPADGTLSIEQAIKWVYESKSINRLNIRQFREVFNNCSLKIEWMVELKENNVDRTALQNASSNTGLSPDELTTKGLSVLLAQKVGDVPLTNSVPN